MKFIKILFILILSLTYGIIQAYKLSNLSFNTIIGNACAPLLIAIAISIIVELVNLVRKKKLSFETVLNRLWKIFLVIIIILFITMELDRLNSSSTTEAKDEVYKSKVIDENPADIKEVGKVKTELLNSDNLYENYVYNYAILFPKNFKVDYGIGENTQVQASEEKTGYVIIVSVVPDGGSKYFEKGAIDNSTNERFIHTIYKEFNTPIRKKEFEAGFEKMGLTEVMLTKMSLTNFSNKSFIKSNFSAMSIVDNKKYQLVLTTFMTFTSKHFYTITFRSWKLLNNKDWLDIINQTMANFHINENIKL
jgi:hypothetical protein